MRAVLSAPPRLGSYEHGRSPAGLLFYESARSGATDLLVRVAQEDDGLVDAENLPGRLNGPEALHEATLHVEDAGSRRDSVFRLEGHSPERAGGPDRVVVTEQE